MNYIAVFRRGGKLMSLFFAYRDESDIMYKASTLIRSEDDVIKAVLLYFYPDNKDIVIKETLLDSVAFKEDNENITEYLRKILDEERDIS